MNTPSTPIFRRFCILIVKNILAVLLGAFAVVSFLSAQTSAGTDGLYAATDNNYRIEVKFAPGKLTVVEPNKTSAYTQRPNTRIYDFKNPTNGIAYVLEVVNEKSLKAYKPGSPQNFTPLKLIRPAPVAAAAETVGARQSSHAGRGAIPAQNLKSLNPDLEELWGARKIDGAELEGRYTPEGEAHPYLELKPTGKARSRCTAAPTPSMFTESPGGSKPTATAP